MTNLCDAHIQWAARPADERFTSLDLLANHVLARRQGSREEVVQVRELCLSAEDGNGIGLNHRHPNAPFTHWAFGQLCTTIGAPAKYLRTLTPELAGDCLRQGIAKSSEQCKLLFRNFEEGFSGSGSMQTAAFTGPKYGRIWDSDVVAALQEAVSGSSWHVPVSRHALPSGLYASDRDVFAFMVSDEAPVEIGNARLGRGFFIWNSETGASTFGLTTFLYNYVCGNHIVWGAEQVQELRIVHRDKAPERYYREALPCLNRFVESRTMSDAIANMVHKAMYKPVGQTVDEVIAWFASKPFSQKEVFLAHSTALQDGDDPSTLWGMVQGLTASAQSLQHIDARVSLERRAGALLC